MKVCGLLKVFLCSKSHACMSPACPYVSIEKLRHFKITTHFIKSPEGSLNEELSLIYEATSSLPSFSTPEVTSEASSAVLDVLPAVKFLAVCDS
jgi:hypothetical protein